MSYMIVCVDSDSKYILVQQVYVCAPLVFNVSGFSRDNPRMGPIHLARKLNVLLKWTLFLAGPT